jgi:hypothetical protein
MTMRHARSLSLQVALALLVCCAPAFAQQKPATQAPTGPTPPAWEQLSAAERDLLIAPIRERWNAEPTGRTRMLEHAKRWQTMTPEQRRAAHDGMRRWSHLNPEQREHARALFERMRGMDPDARRAFREQWRAMTPEQRDAWLDQHPADPKAPAKAGDAPAR